jgi:uncharacterized protein (TIGR03067 family)
MLAAVGLSACRSERSSKGQQANELRGSWRVITQRAVAAGIEIIWTIDDRYIVVTDRDGTEISRSEYRTDSAQTPKHINMTIRDDKAAEDRPGIYQLDGDQLRFAFSVDGSARPSNFDDPEALILKRVVGR